MEVFLPAQYSFLLITSCWSVKQAEDEEGAVNLDNIPN